MTKPATRLLTLTCAAAVAALVAGCNVNEGMLNAGGSALKAVTLSKEDVVQMSSQSCQALDTDNQIAKSNSKYATRLAAIVKPLPKEIEGQTINYKVYMTKDINAWAMDNGCVRVYSGLMDLMNDDEVRGVIGHELGHVALGHSTASMRTAYATSAARQAAAASGNATAAVLSSSAAGALGEAFINAQFSQSQETAADNYSFDLLTQLKLERKGLVTGFQKLAKLSGKSSAASSLLSSHPSSEKRVENLQGRLDKAK
ncbi:peptidase [Lampropedia puyangensis]|uniref:Peptidase n=1 Tax=Lampropedia puyangensis TaxID=1330072 RepID=A0A4S8FCZ6_9BURK|nr:M48 family metalloprotease [Lampropedia puyangensis]THU05400.1 peptidase [Lampropedia puyangensis]